MKSKWNFRLFELEGVKGLRLGEAHYTNGEIHSWTDLERYQPQSVFNDKEGFNDYIKKLSLAGEKDVVHISADGESILDTPRPIGMVELLVIAFANNWRVEGYRMEVKVYENSGLVFHPSWTEVDLAEEGYELIWE